MQSNWTYFQSVMTAEEEKIIQMIRETGRKVVPPGGQVWLYGSRARGDAHKGSDWDILILLNKPALSFNDYSIGYPFRELGWEINEEINPQVYSQKEWQDYYFSPFYKNVEQDKQVLVG